MPDTSLASVISSRICHDLVSPVGAVCNGIDLMRELGGSEGPELDMIGQSAERASSFLQYYRIAFGAVSDGGAGMSGAELHHLVSGYAAAVRVELQWDGAPDQPFTRAEAQVATLMVLCARAMLGMRGRIVVETVAGLRVSALGEQSVCAPDQSALLEGENGALVEPRTVEFAMLADASHRSGRAVRTETEPGRVSLVSA